jgi:micrococcal nuclease
MIAYLTAATLCLAPVVHDGDSIRCGADRIRISNIDAPELPGSPRCEPVNVRRLAASRNPAWCDAALAVRARDTVAAMVLRGPVMLRRTGSDRYGRTLARISVNGRDVGGYLIKLGLARKWQ